MKFFLLAILILLCPLTVVAQNNRRNLPPPPREDGFGASGEGDSAQDINLPPEMRARLAIERAENEHRKVLEDVKKLSLLSSEVAKSYKELGSLSSEELKKISNIEKLAKRILSHAGGDEVDDKSAEAKQMTIAAAVEQIHEAAEKISQNMTAETRHVVSATVIANSNDIINLAQFIRRASK
ncbi:MAG TPA: hypothetical protein VNO70_02505 [Blastocatellia bacterium]|nr:hypothetical protein [Blastocatellia bacterium]